jgi:hypothetical protein
MNSRVRKGKKLSVVQVLGEIYTNGLNFEWMRTLFPTVKKNNTYFLKKKWKTYNFRIKWEIYKWSIVGSELFAINRTWNIQHFFH